MGENNRYSFYEEVPKGYDLLDPKADLDRYGIPPRPDADAEPWLFDFWNKLVSAPFHAKQPKFRRMDHPPHTEPPTEPQTKPPTKPNTFVLASFMRDSVRDHDFFPSRGGTLQSSLNWSGAIVSPPWPKRFIFAAAGWIAPTVRPASVEMTKKYADDSKFPHDSKVLVWVGFDGYNGRLPKISLPQIGTAHWPDGTNEHFAWWDWWRHPEKATTNPQPKNPTAQRRQRHAITMIEDFEVKPGHEMLAGLARLPSKDVLYFIKNQSTGEFRSFLAKRQALRDIEELGSSVEWVVERPTDPNSGHFHMLADYGHVDFNYCMAVAADGPVGPGRRLITLADNGRMMKMREPFRNPSRVVYVSRAARRFDRGGSIGVKCTYHA